MEQYLLKKSIKHIHIYIEIIMHTGRVDQAIHTKLNYKAV